MVRGRLVLVVVVVLAGCQAPAAEPTLEDSIDVEGENLSVSPDRVFAGVRATMDADVTPPQRVTVLANASAFADVIGDTGGSPPRLYELLGLVDRDGLNGTAFERMENGATFDAGFIYVVASPDGDPGSTEWVLAHEFGHYVNLRLDRVSTLRSTLGRTTDEGYVIRAVREGATVYATDAYLARYGDRSEPTAPIYERLLDAVQPGELGRYSFSQYVYGHRYVSGRIDDPAALDAVFENPPTTSEQLLHGYAPEEEPPANLTVSISESDAWRSGGSDRMGEAFVRYVLENGVPPERAADAAAGWGTDRLQNLRPTDGGNSSYAWVLRWDDERNATTFERTLRAYLDERGDVRDEGWTLGSVTADVRSPTDRTTVLLLGDRAVVDGTAVSAPEPGSIELTLPTDSDESPSASDRSESSSR